MAAAVAIIIIVTASLAVLRPWQTRLILSDEDSGRQLLTLPMTEGNRFSVTYTHSVHQTPVTEVYEVRGNDIYVVEARFYTFGAGMQTDYPEGVTLTYAEDGAIVLTGYNTLCPTLVYGVGRIADFTLSYGNEEYPLAELDGRGKFIEFTVK